jgi:sec-independent protein translocase protein TatA
MGPLGWQEMAVIFVLALLLFGPKKLPELGRNLAKGLAEFKRAQNELKATFDREMRSLERENESIKEVTSSYYHDTYNYDYSSYDSGTTNPEAHDSTANTAVITASASAPQGAELTSGAVPEGAVASGSIAAAGIENSAAKAVEPGASENGASSHQGSALPTTEPQTLKS